MSAAPALDALKELAGIREYIQETQRQLQSGTMPDMAGLEQRTEALCAIIQEASSDLQKKCAPELKDLAQQLNDCEKDLHSFYEALVAGVKGKND